MLMDDISIKEQEVHIYNGNNLLSEIWNEYEYSIL